MLGDISYYSYPKNPRVNNDTLFLIFIFLILFTKRRRVRSLKEMLPYYKQLTNLTFLGPHWGTLALGRFYVDLSALGPYCHDLGPMFPVEPSRLVVNYLRTCVLDYLKKKNICIQLGIQTKQELSQTSPTNCSNEYSLLD